MVGAVPVYNAFMSVTGIEMREMGNGNIDSVPANRGSVFVKRCLAKLSIYRRQEIYAAGVGLAFLYFTVLGFDGVRSAHVPLHNAVVGYQISFSSQRASDVRRACRRTSWASSAVPALCLVSSEQAHTF